MSFGTLVALGLNPGKLKLRLASQGESKSNREGNIGIFMNCQCFVEGWRDQPEDRPENKYVPLIDVIKRKVDSLDLKDALEHSALVLAASYDFMDIMSYFSKNPPGANKAEKKQYKIVADALNKEFESSIKFIKKKEIKRKNEFINVEKKEYITRKKLTEERIKKNLNERRNISTILSEHNLEERSTIDLIQILTTNAELPDKWSLPAKQINFANNILEILKTRKDLSLTDTSLALDAVKKKYGKIGILGVEVIQNQVQFFFTKASRAIRDKNPGSIDNLLKDFNTAFKVNNKGEFGATGLKKHLVKSWNKMKKGLHKLWRILTGKQKQHQRNKVEKKATLIGSGISRDMLAAAKTKSETMRNREKIFKESKDSHDASLKVSVPLGIEKEPQIQLTTAQEIFVVPKDYKRKQNIVQEEQKSSQMSSRKPSVDIKPQPPLLYEKKGIDKTKNSKKSFIQAKIEKYEQLGGSLEKNTYNNNNKSKVFMPKSRKPLSDLKKKFEGYKDSSANDSPDAQGPPSKRK